MLSKIFKTLLFLSIITFIYVYFNPPIVDAATCGTWSCGNCIIPSCGYRTSDGYCYNASTTGSGARTCYTNGGCDVYVDNVKSCNGYMTASQCSSQDRSDTINCS